jgi:hypothetical protein
MDGHGGGTTATADELEAARTAVAFLQLLAVALRQIKNSRYDRIMVRPESQTRTGSLAYIARPNRGWSRPRESRSYLRRVSGECPASVRRVSGETPMSLLGSYAQSR